MAAAALAGLIGLLLLLSLLPLWRHPAWWIRGLDFPRLQIACGLAALLLVSAFVLEPARPLHLSLLLAALGGLAYQLWWILPYSRLCPVEVQAADADADNTLRIMVANVLTTNRRADDLLAMVDEYRPDLLVTLESDHWWQSRLDVLDEGYPHAVKCPLDNLYGMHLYSRLPLEDAKVQFLVESDIPSIHALAHLPSGRTLRLHCLHPAPPSPSENEESTERDAELVMVGKSAAAADEPVIVTGDLNDVAWSETTRLFRRISGLLDPRVGRGMFNSYHAGYPFLRWPLDHLFHSRDFRLVDIRRLPAFGSDHFPVLVTLVLTQAPEQKDEGLDADADDHAQATEKMKAGTVRAADVHAPGD
jgi:endonuclease/exonuclease/phosphatase (EEP) superfamily protein YafD